MFVAVSGAKAAQAKLRHLLGEIAFVRRAAVLTSLFLKVIVFHEIQIAAQMKNLFPRHCRKIILC